MAGGVWRYAFVPSDLEHFPVELKSWAMGLFKRSVFDTMNRLL